MWYIRKCFGLKSKFINIRWMTFHFNSSLYPNGIRPSSTSFISAVLHLPNQISLSGSFGKYDWPKRMEKKGHNMWFDIQQVEVLKTCNKRNDPCVPNELNFDQMILDYYLEKLGCKAPYHKTDDSMEICDSTRKHDQGKF